MRSLFFTFPSSGKKKASPLHILHNLIVGCLWLISMTDIIHEPPLLLAALMSLLHEHAIINNRALQDVNVIQSCTGEIDSAKKGLVWAVLYYGYYGQTSGCDYVYKDDWHSVVLVTQRDNCVQPITVKHNSVNVVLSQLSTIKSVSNLVVEVYKIISINHTHKKSLSHEDTVLKQLNIMITTDVMSVTPFKVNLVTLFGLERSDKLSKVSPGDKGGACQQSDR